MVDCPAPSPMCMPAKWPARPFDGLVEHTRRVSPTGLVHFERNRYSVPASFANRQMSLRVYTERIVIAAEGQVLCKHERIVSPSHRLPGRTVYDQRPYPAVIRRRPGALRNGAPFTGMPDAFRQVQACLLKRPGGDREMVEILSLVLQHDEQAVLCAAEPALEEGVPTRTRILNPPHRPIDGKPTRPTKMPSWQGGLSCVMTLQAPPSWSCCAPSGCTAWPGPPEISSNRARPPSIRRPPSSRRCSRPRSPNARSVGRGAAVPPALKALRTHRRRYNHQPQLQ